MLHRLAAIACRSSDGAQLAHSKAASAFAARVLRAPNSATFRSLERRLLRLCSEVGCEIGSIALHRSVLPFLSDEVVSTLLMRTSLQCICRSRLSAQSWRHAHTELVSRQRNGILDAAEALAPFSDLGALMLCKTPSKHLAEDAYQFYYQLTAQSEESWEMPQGIIVALARKIVGFEDADAPSSWYDGVCGWLPHLPLIHVLRLNALCKDGIQGSFFVKTARAISMPDFVSMMEFKMLHELRPSEVKAALTFCRTFTDRVMFIMESLLRKRDWSLDILSYFAATIAKRGNGVCFCLCMAQVLRRSGLGFNMSTMFSFERLACSAVKTPMERAENSSVRELLESFCMIVLQYQGPCPSTTVLHFACGVVHWIGSPARVRLRLHDFASTRMQICRNAGDVTGTARAFAIAVFVRANHSSGAALRESAGRFFSDELLHCSSNVSVRDLLFLSRALTFCVPAPQVLEWMGRQAAARFRGNPETIRLAVSVSICLHRCRFIHPGFQTCVCENLHSGKLEYLTKNFSGVMQLCRCHSASLLVSNSDHEKCVSTVSLLCEEYLNGDKHRPPLAKLCSLLCAASSHFLSQPRLVQAVCDSISGVSTHVARRSALFLCQSLLRQECGDLPRSGALVTLTDKCMSSTVSEHAVVSSSICAEVCRRSRYFREIFVHWCQGLCDSRGTWQHLNHLHEYHIFLNFLHEANGGRPCSQTYAALEELASSAAHHHKTCDWVRWASLLVAWDIEDQSTWTNLSRLILCHRSQYTSFERLFLCLLCGEALPTGAHPGEKGSLAASFSFDISLCDEMESGVATFAELCFGRNRLLTEKFLSLCRLWKGALSAQGTAEATSAPILVPYRQLRKAAAEIYFLATCDQLAEYDHSSVPVFDDPVDDLRDFYQ